MLPPFESCFDWWYCGDAIAQNSGWKRTGSSADIVEGELGHARVELEEERQGLANAAGSAEDGDLGELQHR
jgi:hypothetical protein